MLSHTVAPQIRIFRKLNKLNLNKIESKEQLSTDIAKYLIFISQYCDAFEKKGATAENLTEFIFIDLSALSKDYSYESKLVTNLDRLIKYLEDLSRKQNAQQEENTIPYPYYEKSIKRLKALREATKQQFQNQQLELIQSNCYRYQSTLLSTLQDQIAGVNHSYIRYHPNKKFDDPLPVIEKMPLAIEVLKIEVVLPRDLLTLQISNRAYVRTGDELYFIDKINGICTQITITPENLAAFDNIVQLENSSNKLIDEEQKLKEIATLTGRILPPQYRFYSPVQPSKSSEKFNSERSLTEEELQRLITPSSAPSDYTQWQSFVLSDFKICKDAEKYIFYDKIRRSVTGKDNNETKINNLAQVIKSEPRGRIILAAHRNPLLRIIEAAINKLFGVKCDETNNTLPLQVWKTKGIRLFNSIANSSDAFAKVDSSESILNNSNSDNIDSQNPNSNPPIPQH